MDNRIGIMSVVHEGRKPFGMQTYFFEDMVKSFPDQDLELFFFSPMDWNPTKEEVLGYNFRMNEWIETSGTIPDIIYDRSFSSDEEQKVHLEHCRQFLKESNHTILNPFDLVDILNNKIQFHSFLQAYGIPTLSTYPFEAIKSEAIFQSINSSKLYIKPTFGSKGEGIFVIEKKENNYLLYDNLGNSESFDVYADVINRLETDIKFEDRYFIQEEAKTELFEDAPFDIRVLVQNYGEEYKVTGKAMRIGQKHSMTSNLNSGGNAIPLEEMASFFIEKYDYSIVQLQSDIEKLCLDCSENLRKEFGEFCEIGFDILVTKDMGPIIIEGNAKPSRWVFVKMADYLKKIGKDNSYYMDRRRETVSVPMKYALYLRIRS